MIFIESPFISIIELLKIICSTFKRIILSQIFISLELDSSLIVFKIDLDEIPNRVLC